MANELIHIIGCGPGGAACLTGEAREAASRASALIGAERLLDLFPESKAERIATGADVAAALAAAESRRKEGPVAILVSGDAGLYSLARRVIERFGPAACRVVPGISSLQVAYARLGLDWANVRVVHAHGEVPEETPESLRGEDRITIFAGGASSAPWIARLISELFTTHRCVVCHDLTLETERVERYDSVPPEADLAGSRVLVLLIRKELLP